MRRRREPRRRVVGDPIERPASKGPLNGVLVAVLGEVEVPRPADEAGDDPQALGGDDLGQA
jgi:hypothetical protein